MKRIITLGVVGAMCLATRTLAAEGIWTTKTSMPTPRMYLSTSVVEGRIYAIGGATRATVNTAVTLRTVEEYEPVTDTWTARSPMPTARWGLSACTVKGKIYAIGGAEVGVSPLRTVEEYDAATDTWTVKSPMPTARWGLATSVVDGKIYALGGMISAGFGCRIVEEYDPAMDTWTTKAAMNLDRYAPAACAVNGKVYVLGGVPSYPQVTATVEEYDPQRDTWTMKGSLLGRKTYFSASEVNGRIYAIGGAPHPDNATAIVYEYDPITGTSTAQSNLRNPRTVLSTSAVDGRIYAIGGSTGGWPWPPSGLVEEYTVRPLIVDFNGDGIVDLDDLVILIQHWGQADLRFDIGPRPWGDGKVDAKDLEVLMDYWKQEVDDPTLVGFWPFDETEGLVANDRAGGNQGSIMGSPQWRPTGGRVDGAIELDGATNIVANTPLNPADGPCSVLTWIRGGAPGQVIISQMSGVPWLMAEAGTGTLMTELSKTGRKGDGLSSQAIITDGDWHRIAFTWDGASRRLHVDGVLVAEDAHDALAAGKNSLVLGASHRLTPGTFWSGLIDDLRIYRRAVKP